MSTNKFSTIFRGLELAHGTYVVDKKQANGKHVGQAKIIREPRTTEHWQQHLVGTRSLGIIPINEKNKCVWGCIDIDIYNLNHADLISRIRKLKLPLVVCRSKSGGGHVFLFTKDWIPAKDMQDSLSNIASALGYNGCEIFPKQVKLHIDKGDVGNFLNMPYYNADAGLRYAFKDDGSACTLQEFFGLYDQYAQTHEQVNALNIIEDTPVDSMKDAPPCLQALFKRGFEEGSRNNGLFNVGVYLRKAFPNSWESEILAYNSKYFDPPLPLNEVNSVAKQLERKDYTYKCSDEPIKAFCNKSLCSTKKYGVQAIVTNTAIANLRKYNSNPPIWFMDVNSEPVELDTESLMKQPNFQKACIEQLNFLPPTVNRPQWEQRLNALLTNMTETEGSIITASEDSSIDGQFYEYLEEFCVHLQTAEDKEEILLRRPWSDAEKGLTFFRLKDFSAHLRKNRFFEYKTHQISQRLRDIGGQPSFLKIKGKSVRVWQIPSFEEVDMTVEPRNLGGDEEMPF